MYFIRYQPIKERLRARKVTDREALPYFILFCVLETIVVSFPAVSEMNRWDVLSALLNIIVVIFGVYYIYRKNGGVSGYDMIHKYVVLGWIVAVRYFIVITPVGITIFFIAKHYGCVGNDTSLATAIFYAVIFAIYYERLGRHIADTNASNCEQAAAPDRGPLGRSG